MSIGEGCVGVFLMGSGLNVRGSGHAHSDMQSTISELITSQWFKCLAVCNEN